MPTPNSTDCEEPPAGTVKSIIPCTPLAIVKCLEFIGIYNKILPYGDRAYGKTITVINRYVRHTRLRKFLQNFFRSEVVGRPLAALLANDGARVLSVDIESIQVKEIIALQRR
jgi:methylenetetrahydrofolate dehydrogenase (NAD+)